MKPPLPFKLPWHAPETPESAAMRALVAHCVAQTYADAGWNAFQQFRERSMADFTADLNRFIKSKKDITVTFQSSPIIYGWSMGQSNGIADEANLVPGQVLELPAGA